LLQAWNRLISLTIAIFEVVMSTVVSNTSLSRSMVLVALVSGLLLAASLGLWAYYGTAVFLEMARAGWAACF
jgi:hypothetical protein